MNKLVVSNGDDVSDIIVTDEDMYIKMGFEDASQIVNVDVMDNMNLMVFETSKNTKSNVTYNVRSGASVIINKLAINNGDTTVINLVGYGSSVTLNNSVVNYNDNTCVTTINHMADNTKSYIANHGINVNDGVLNFTVNGKVGEHYKNCSSNQDNKIINLNDGKSFIKPNLIVDSNLVDIYHSAYIGSFDDEALFYLKSRGIREDDCNALLIKGFLIGKMELNENEREELEQIIEEM